MRRTLLLLAIASAVLGRPASAQGASGFVGVSATVLPAPATASLGAELSVRQTRRGVEVSAPLTRAGSGPAIISVERRGGGPACDLGRSSEAGAAGGDAAAGRMTCSLSLAEAGRAGGADVPVSILIVPAT
jgi:hypothetical protein